ncbi:LacI family DNA-binding transcriptional regulator [Leifsonia sp. Root112D2]|uniref:LacI family DNA-binding transcriptional regulator n=1 Tax=Leifsonia sp. Root112D2 TaxID=1736426 RepID=UPI000700E2FE|nr:helix-turn-helix transcriptional regulator [Leifsonia sp. Root112D2]KQV06452.1 hypothetical protein ASC63_03140 [Leifsonia sp. Root112D2]
MVSNPSGERPATILQVAMLAGASKATVSRVLNGYPTVNPEIVKQVRNAIDELDFNPSATARNLSLGRTQTIGVFVPDLENRSRPVECGVSRHRAGQLV